VSTLSADDWPVELCRDRVHRAGEVRDAIGDEWSQYMDAAVQPRRFSLVRADAANAWTFTVNTLVPMPLRLSTLFGEWLYLLRAALDGIVYSLGVRDSGQDPPPAQRSLQFPILLDPVKYDGTDHRGKLQALSDTTFGLPRQVQPFNAQPDHLSNVLWWREELASIDRHRRGHALAPQIISARVGLREPLRLVKNHLPQPIEKPVPVDEWQPMPIIDFEAPPDWEEFQIRDHIDITDALTTVLDVPEWVDRAGAAMASQDLGQRMARCELFILYNVIDPLAAGSATQSPPTLNGG
jgi:hypothetical protein